MLCFDRLWLRMQPHSNKFPYIAGALAPDTLCHECGTHSNKFPHQSQGALAPDAATLLARLVVGVAGCALTLISLSLSVLLFWSEIFT